MEDVDAEIADLKSKDTSVDAEIADLISKDTSVEDSIANIVIKITDIESNDNTTNSKIVDLEEDIVSSPFYLYSKSSYSVDSHSVVFTIVWFFRSDQIIHTVWILHNSVVLVSDSSLGQCGLIHISVDFEKKVYLL